MFLYEFMQICIYIYIYIHIYICLGTPGMSDLSRRGALLTLTVKQISCRDIDTRSFIERFLRDPVKKALRDLVQRASSFRDFVQRSYQEPLTEIRDLSSRAPTESLLRDLFKSLANRPCVRVLYRDLAKTPLMEILFRGDLAKSSIT